MKWSRYNVLFESRRNGWLLFNMVSRAFLAVAPEQLDAIRSIQADPDHYDYTNSAMLYMQLRSMGVLVEEGMDEAFYNVQKMRTLTRLYGDSSLSLTIAITRACNFDCSYCFEGNRTGRPMGEEVEKKLMRFIRSHRAGRLNIIWYGGEPLMAFDRILSINSQLKELGKPYTAAMITNGYLLTDEKVAQLNDLKISTLQITLDGCRETHNGRRYLKNGGATYDTILSNVERVMASDFKGIVNIRVNVDTRNEDEFIQVYQEIQSRFPKDYGKRIWVYPGFVKGDDHPQSSCFFDSRERGVFLAKMYEKYNIAPLHIFPTAPNAGCTLTKRNAFVVGPDGELYKCWDDVGLPHKIVGTLDIANNWNMPLIAEGMVAASYLESQECRDCLFFPICDGGCHRVRQDNLHREKQVSSCTYFKDNLETLLELFYEKRLELGKKNEQ